MWNERSLLPLVAATGIFNRLDLYSFLRVITNNFRPPAPYNSRVSCAALFRLAFSKKNLSDCKKYNYGFASPGEA